MEDLGHIKGQVVRQFLDWYAERNGDAAVAALHAAMPEASRGLFVPGERGHGILSSRWYPALQVHAMLDAFVATVPAGQLPVLAEDAARTIMGWSMRGIYRTLFRLVASPERFVKYQQKLWDQHYDSGEIFIRELSEGVHEHHIRAWPGHHRFICELNAAASLPIYEYMGLSGVSSERRACVALGDAECVNLVRFSS